jgi:nickel transport protein
MFKTFEFLSFGIRIFFGLFYKIRRYSDFEIIRQLGGSMKHNDLESNLAKPIMVLFIVICVWCLLIEAANAHGVSVFAWVDGNTVYVESKFSGGKKVKAGKIIVTDSQGVELLHGTTNDQGEFSFKIPKKTALTIELSAGAGHRAEWVIPVSEMDISDKKEVLPEEQTAINELPAAAKSQVETGMAGNMQPLSGLTAEDLQAAVEKAVEKKLQPVMKILAESKQRGPTVKDVFSGIGYIIGLVGIAAYINSRKKKKSDREDTKI